MEEKIIIQGDIQKGSLLKIIVGIITVIALIYGVLLFVDFIIVCCYGNLIEEDYYVLGGAIISFIISIIFFNVWRLMRKSELVVSDQRVYGKTIFGKRVDLPIDSVSAVGTSAFKGIDIGTSSGRIHFKFIKNNYEIHSVISKLLMERQQAEKANNAQNNEKLSNADELKKYKDLLDSGVITSEEFEQKKKQLLGL